ncbi:hypothetical protein COV82_05340 [Candidatus Peregrinibacteria bacterium CG11_big_fil_rev_8_21_14_0_20_46_8]|nr:MAG: hypothetical protein COV82_05340 [Candidatus Peregrinibacteria bacterium CG11_big_fil_rev_8_21_14_0_20_46_8]
MHPSIPKPGTELFQSRLFGEFQKKIPYRGGYWELDGTIVIPNKMRFGSWLWVPYGPQGYAPELFSELENVARTAGAVYARIEPAADWPGDEAISELKKKYRITPAPHRFTPECTLVLNLEKSEEQLLQEMKPKGRYNIKVAQRNGVIIKQGEKITDAVYELFRETGMRDRFNIHPKKYYELLVSEFPGAVLWTAEHNGNLCAAIIVITYNDVATYYYGASGYAQRSLMAPYLLQWEAIRDAKSRGCTSYDFLGIAPPEEHTPNFAGDNANNKTKMPHPLAGVTQFKKKFGGETICFGKGFDIVYRKLPYMTLITARKLRGG